VSGVGGIIAVGTPGAPDGNIGAGDGAASSISGSGIGLG
jgi:hypothetical protein